MEPYAALNMWALLYVGPYGRRIRGCNAALWELREAQIAHSFGRPPTLELGPLGALGHQEGHDRQGTLARGPQAF